MKKLLAPLALLLALYSCNNGGYTATPNTNGQTPNNNSNNTTCTISPADTACSCTDSLSWYVNGVLYTGDTVWAVHATTGSTGAFFGSVYVNSAGLYMAVNNYTGPGTYTIADNDAEMHFTGTDTVSYDASDVGDDCDYIKLVITEDNGTIVKGKFYGVVSREVPDVYPDYHIEYRAVKGGHFIARWH